ncbi:MAG TPA: ketosamine-3-kinase [Bacteroidales bacterium]|nr:MAG: hypothetical protein A2X11_11135 [Bacteroidetes bacterium GWE2_42_24]OFY29376.1 MAG: hypothetical protein A2X09_14890 [Bacteroidetes bacterium GWF2_43_11]HAQ65487.1 ketosamine-3-kinase [Bacteroidales bacterium]HBZ67258.1 ketosamine-3-kinase [Bacteroidales bacterium]
MAVSGNIPDLLPKILPEVAKDFSPVLSVMPITGGDINRAWKISTTNGQYFLKSNRTGLYPGLYKCEAEALRILASTHTVTVPGVLWADDNSDPPFLLMGYIEPGRAGIGTYEEAGRALAALHRCTSTDFGFSSNNYIGSLWQINDRNADFNEFFIRQRLMPLTIRAVEASLAPESLIGSIEALSGKLKAIIPAEPPALLHGDLWHGNLMADQSGHPVFIDPAVYYGHRESDLAMTQLFGGFPDCFYHAYNETYPLESGWQQRRDLFNLYPLLVHLILFGVSYLGQIKQILRKV